MPPVNDNFANRITLTGNLIHTNGTTLDATVEPGEPDHAGIPTLSSIWWTWTAPSTGTVAIDTFYSGDTTLAVYTGSTVNNLTEVASNDNFFSDAYLEHSSIVSFIAIAGTTYQIAVDSVYQPTDSIHLNLELKATPLATRTADFGFESGNFTNWTTIGNASIQTAAFGSYPTEGNYQALMSTDSADFTSDTAIENFLGLSAGTLDSLLEDSYEYTVTDGSALKLTTITVNAGDILSFDWNFLSNLETPTNDRDLAFVSLGSELVFKLTDLYASSSSILSPTPYFLETGYQTFEYKFTTAGTYTVGIGIVDAGYDGGSGIFVSGLLVDNLNLFSEMMGTSSNDCLNSTINNPNNFV